MGLSQAVPCRTIQIHDARIAVTCPKCKSSSMFKRPTVPHIDSCGFESHSFRCEWCASLLAGIIDPSDRELVSPYKKSRVVDRYKWSVIWPS